MTQRVSVAVIDVLESADDATAWVREPWIVDGESIELMRMLYCRAAEGQLAEWWLYDHDQALVGRVLSATTPGP